MAVSKHYLNEDKTKFNWRVVVYIPTGEYDRFGKPIKNINMLVILQPRVKAKKQKEIFLML